MQIYRLISSLFLLGVLCFTGTVAAQINPRNDPNAGASGTRGSHSIRGKIYLPSGQLPEQRMRVSLELSSGGTYAEVFSDSVGNFEFRSLPNNNYRIVIPSDGRAFDPAQESIEVSGSLPRTFSVQIYLREKSDDRLTSSNKMLAAGEIEQNVPKAAKKSYELGLKRMKDGKQDEASALFQDAVKTFPEYIQAHNKLGECLVNQNKPGEAQAEFEKALVLAPKSPHTHINLGMRMVRLKRYPEAIEHLEFANRLDESFPMSHLFLGLAFMEKTPSESSDLDKAERAFQKALALGGNQMSSVHKYLFNIYVRRKNYEKAASELEVYLSENPNAPDVPQIREMLAKIKKTGALPK